MDDKQKNSEQQLTYGKAKDWAQMFYQKVRLVLNEHANGKRQLTEKQIKQYEQWKAMDETDLIQFHYRIQHLKGEKNITDQEFEDLAPELGYTNQSTINLIFNERLNTYLDYYKIDPDNPGLSYVVRQVVQDEFEMNKIRKEIALIDTEFYAKTTDKEDIRKKLNDTLDKINKRLYEYTKNLKAEREDALEKLKNQQEDEAGSLEVRVNEIIIHEDIEGIYRQAYNLRKEKEQQIIEEDLDLHG